jgi:hypothetical protein
MIDEQFRFLVWLAPTIEKLPTGSRGVTASCLLHCVRQKTAALGHNVLSDLISLGSKAVIPAAVVSQPRTVPAPIR